MRFKKPSSYTLLSRFQRVSRIQKYSQSDKDKYYSEIFGLSSTYITDEKRIKEVIRYTNHSIRDTQEFRDYFGKAIIAFIGGKIKSRTRFGSCHTMKYIHLINFCINCNLLSDSIYKNAMIDIILTFYNNFYLHLKKSLAEIVTKLVELNDEERIFQILNAFKYSMSVNSFAELMTKISGGMDNPDIKKILSGINKFECIRYTEEEIKSDDNKRRQLIRSIIKRPTMAKDINFAINVAMEDIKSLPPITRFEFFKLACDELFQILILPKDISIQEVKNLLFTACLHKNEECSNWLRNHEGKWDDVSKNA